MKTLFFICFQAFLPVIIFFSSSGNVILKRTLHSGQWKLIFWLVETILCIYLNIPSIVFFNIPSTVFLSLGNIFEANLYYSQWQRIFCLVETIFLHSHFFRNHYCNRGRPIFKKENLISARRNRFLQFFSDTDSNGSSFSVQ